MKVLTNLDLVKNELQNAVIQNLATAPANPKKGQVYFDTTSNLFKYWNGTSWEVGDNIIEKIKLGGVELTITDRAVDIPVDNALSSTSTNPVQNKVVDKAIKDLDVAEIGESGKYVQKVSETDGKISATIKTLVKSGDKVLTFSEDGIDATLTLKKVSAESWVYASNTKYSRDASKDGLDTTIPDYIYAWTSDDNYTMYSNTETPVVGDTLKKTRQPFNFVGTAEISEVHLASPAVATQYQLQGKNGEVLGDTINIYKDQLLKTAQIGHVDDTINATTGVITSGTGNTALDLVFSVYNQETETHSYTLVTIDIEAFLTENEFGDGLQVNNHKVSVKKDATSEDFLSVSANGIKVSGIKQAIDAKGYQSLIEGDGSTKEFTISHNLKNKFPNVTIWDYESKSMVMTDVVATDEDNLVVKFAVAPAVGKNYAVSLHYCGSI